MGNTKAMLRKDDPESLESAALAAKHAQEDDKRSIEEMTKPMSALICIGVLGVLACFLTPGAVGMYLGVVLVVVLGGFLFFGYLCRSILAHPTGSPEMIAVADAIRSGSQGYLSVQYGAIARASGVVAVAIFGIYLYKPTGELAVSPSTMAGLTSISFLCGAVCSAMAGYVGVWISVRANLRVAAAAADNRYDLALVLAFHGGAASSVLSASMCIFGISLLYVLFSATAGLAPERVPVLLVGYGFGASFVALFMQLGGGIYTKAADVGADMIGNIEQG